MEPRLGAATEYATNPDLRIVGERSEYHAAALLDLPIHYDLDTLHFSLIPRMRYSDSRGYSSLASNYFHLDANAQLASERGSTTLSAGSARDSSLYHGGEALNGIGVRRDTALAALDWQHDITARAQFQFDVSWTRVKYGQTSLRANLVDYRYVSAAPTLGYALTERDTLKIMGSAGRYASLDGFTQSKDIELQLGFDRRLSEVWTLAASAGYSRSTNQYNFLFGTLESKQKGGVYSASLTRRADAFSLTASASRALHPSGFGFLSRQDNLSLKLDYTYSERWSFSAVGSWQKTVDPIVRGGTINRRYYSSQLTADWHWTPECVLSVRAARIGQQYGPPTVNAASTGISFEIFRQFYRIAL